MRAMKRRVLVTGGSGFIGQWTCRELFRCGYEPVVFDRSRRSPTPLWPVEFGDIRDALSVHQAVDGCRGVIHLAGVLGTQETVRHPRVAAEVNVLGTLNVLDACRAHDSRCVVISVGNWWMGNPYSISKHCAERFAVMCRAELGQEVSVVRALNAYGPGQKERPVRKIVPTFMRAAMEGRPIEVYGDGEQVMDMVFVEDVARALVGALEELPTEVVEAGTGVETTVNEIAAAVIRAVGSSSTIEYLPMRPGEEPGAKVVADTRTLPLVGVSPKDLVSLDDGLARTVEAMRRAPVPVA